MKKRAAILILSVFLLLHFSCTIALAQEASSRIILPDMFSSKVLLLSDGSFLVYGRSHWNDLGYASDQCINLDDTGEERWRVEMPATFEETHFTSAIELDDGVVAIMQSDRTDATEALKWSIVRVQDGNILGIDAVTPGNDATWPVLLPAREGYLVFYGERAEPDAFGGFMHIPVLEKRDMDGTSQWRYVFRDELHFENCISVDGGYVFSGSVEVQDNDRQDTQGIFAKLTDAGELDWTLKVPSDRWKTFGEMWQRPDGTILSTGRHMFDWKGDAESSSELLLACITADGTLLWEKAYGTDAPWYWLAGRMPFEEGFLAFNIREGERVPSELLFLDGEFVVKRRDEIDWPNGCALVNLWRSNHGNDNGMIIHIQDMETKRSWIEFTTVQDYINE